MSKINELIQTLCPDGVEYKKIRDVYTRLRGTSITAGKMKEIADENGDVRIFAGGKTVINAFEKDIPRANITRVPAVLVQSRGVIDFVYYDKPFTFKNEMWAYTHENTMSVQYLCYVLKNNAQTFRNEASGMGSMPQISLSVTEDFEIPVPPLPVQEEIVRILDEYTELEAELEAKLSEEIKLKQKQYEFYMDKLLTFGDDVERKRLGDKSLFKISRGVVISKPYVKEHSGKYPVYSSQTENDGCLGCIDTYAVDGERVTWTTDGAKAGTVFYRNGKYNITNVCGMIECLNSTKINCKYLSYVFSIVAPNYVNKGMGNPKLMSNIVELIEIPVPSPTEQERIVKILDKYDTYTRDMISTLNIELESRKKQYAYYRDQLLTFKRKE